MGETWSFTLREEHVLSVFENVMLRKISGSKNDEATGRWRKLHINSLIIYTLRQMLLE
jgi:hypothetical protein